MDERAELDILKKQEPKVQKITNFADAQRYSNYRPSDEGKEYRLPSLNPDYLIKEGIYFSNANSFLRHTPINKDLKDQYNAVLRHFPRGAELDKKTIAVLNRIQARNYQETENRKPISIPFTFPLYRKHPLYQAIIDRALVEEHRPKQFRYRKMAEEFNRVNMVNARDPNSEEFKLRRMNLKNELGDNEPLFEIDLMEYQKSPEKYPVHMKYMRERN